MSGVAVKRSCWNVGGQMWKVDRWTASTNWSSFTSTGATQILSAPSTLLTTKSLLPKYADYLVSAASSVRKGRFSSRDWTELVSSVPFNSVAAVRVGLCLWFTDWAELINVNVYANLRIIKLQSVKCDSRSVSDLSCACGLRTAHNRTQRTRTEATKHNPQCFNPVSTDRKNQRTN